MKNPRSRESAERPRAGTIAPQRGLQSVPRQTQKERIYAEVRRALLAGQFAPGEAITVKLLAEEIGAGTMPIREALQRLSAEGALLSLPTGRVRVPHFTANEFDEIKEIRLRLEGLAAHQAATRIDLASLKQVTRSFREVTRLITSGAKPTEIVAHNHQFHFQIYAAADSPHLLSLIDGLWLRVSPLLTIPFKTAGGARTEYLSAHSGSHARLIAALGAADGTAAEAAIREIITASAAWYQKNHEFLDHE